MHPKEFALVCHILCAFEASVGAPFECTIVQASRLLLLVDLRSALTLQ